jgi:hypothetical protein
VKHADVTESHSPARFDPRPTLTGDVATTKGLLTASVVGALSDPILCPREAIDTATRYPIAPQGRLRHDLPAPTEK